VNEPPPAAVPPPAAAPAAAPLAGLARPWAWLAALLLLAVPLGTPYEAALFARATRYDPLSHPGTLLLERAIEAIAFGFPAAWLGLWLARPLGWGAPYLAGTRPRREGVARIAAALLAGVALGALIAVASVAVPHLWPRAFPLPPGGGASSPAAWKGALSALAAGVDEEVLTRLLLVSLLARAYVAALRRHGPPPLAATWAAIAIAALGFGAMHFANVAVLGLPHSFANLAFVLLLNGALGLAAGWAFVAYGIEAAIALHFAAALVAHGVFPALERVL
jgi:hypothetical protein